MFTPSWSGSEPAVIMTTLAGLLDSLLLSNGLFPDSLSFFTANEGAPLGAAAAVETQKS